MANRTNDLTPKELHFCRCVASGMTQGAAYREAFDCQAGSLSKTQKESASRLMSKPAIRVRVDVLIALSDGELVLTKLEQFIDHPELSPEKQVALRAVDLPSSREDSLCHL